MTEAKVAPQPDAGTSSVELHNRERKDYWKHPGICTVTFVQGSAKEALAAVRTRLAAALQANPWAAGQFVQKRLVFPLTITDAVVDEILSSTRCAAVSRATPYPTLVKTVAKDAALSVQKGSTTQSLGARVTKLVVVEPEAAGDGEFAIIFSMSHVAADGHDYYKMLNMIAGDAAVTELNPVRVAEYETREAEWTGAKDFNWLTGGALVKGMLTGMCCGPKSAWECYFVNAEKVAEVKAEVASTYKSSNGQTAQFVSTNDIVTSHFCNAANARVCMMVVNMRDKIDIAVTDTHAGCYEGCLLLDCDNSNNPQKIRKCLAAGFPYTRQTESRPLPGFCCTSCPMAFITTWATFPFAKGVEPLGGVTKQLLHLPCMDMPDMMDVAIVFRPCPGKIAVIYLAKRAKGNLSSGGVLGACLDERMFPSK